MIQPSLYELQHMYVYWVENYLFSSARGHLVNRLLSAE